MTKNLLKVSNEFFTAYRDYQWQAAEDLIHRCELNEIHPKDILDQCESLPVDLLYNIIVELWDRKEEENDLSN